MSDIDYSIDPGFEVPDIITFSEEEKLSDDSKCVRKYAVEHMKNKKRVLVSEIWYTDNEIHRDGNPAWIEYYENGTRKEERWYKENKRHQDVVCEAGIDLPAITEYYENGNKKAEYWYTKNRLHRTTIVDDEKETRLPAEIHYSKNGEITEQSWFEKGKNITENIQGIQEPNMGYKSKRNLEKGSNYYDC